MAIGKPRYDTRPGAQASATARLWITAIICAVQYWLLTSSMEAMHAGNEAVALPAFLASLACFFLAAGLVLTGEVGSRKVREDLKKEDPKPPDISEGQYNSQR